MSRLVAWSVHLSTLAVGLTGVVYGVMRYLLKPADEFALVNHPQEPAWRVAHLLAAPLLVFACGLIWRAHVWQRLAQGQEERRWTGLGLALLLLPMAASGYLLQVAETELWRSVWMWLHGTSSVAWLLAYGLHRLGPDD